jgi:CheY-like chemotaxis protein
MSFKPRPVGVSDVSAKQAASAAYWHLDDMLPPLRVLLVEDHLDAATSTAEVLRLDGHEVSFAMDGLAALAAAQAIQPDVVILDIGLPKMDGYEVAQRLAASCPEKAYLIALTGYGSQEARRRSAEAGIDLHLTKPVDPEQLLRILQFRRQSLTG